MSQYAFILGRVYTLSLAELLNYFAQKNLPIKILDASPEVLIIETESYLDIEQIQKNLGGTIKILKIVDILQKREQDSINFSLQNYFKPSRIKKDFLKDYSGKIQFGVSVYLLDMNLKAFGEAKRIGMFIKRAMQDSGASIRLVLPEYNAMALASVVVTKNLLLSKGAEIVVIAGMNKVYTAKTLVVQDFEDYGRRDYQRPFRDALQGMIPPKVAQIMLNFSQAKSYDTIIDPFCGIGTIVQEGILQNYKMLGTDINSTAIANCEKNLEWFRNRYKIAKGRYHVEVADAKNVSNLIENLISVGALKEISGVVTEGYLGPVYSKFPTESEIEDNFQELTELYKDSFAEFNKFLKSGQRIVICLPAYRKNQEDYVMFPEVDFIADLGYNLVNLIPSTLASAFSFLKLTERGTAIYDRKDQIVAREIVIFEKR